MTEVNKTPKEIVSELDQYIIGQDEAKRSVAIALRNRYRRMQLEETMQQEVTPKNINDRTYRCRENGDCSTFGANRQGAFR